MPDRYDDYTSRPTRSGTSYRPTASSDPSKNTAPRPAIDTSRPRTAQTRPAGYTSTRPAQSRPAGYTASSRPAQTRPAGYTSSSRSTQRPAGQSSPQRSTAARPAGQSSAQHPTQRRTTTSSSTQRPRSASGSSARPTSQQNRYAAQSSSSSGGMPPFIRVVCLLLFAAILVVGCVGIVNHIRSRQVGPIIQPETTNEGDALSLSTSTDANAAPVSSDEAVPPASTDVPAQVPGTVPIQSGAAPLTNTGGRTARIRAIGDVIIDNDMLDFAYNKSDDSYDFSTLFPLAQGVMADADWTIINIEATLRKGKYGYDGYPQFSTPPSILTALTQCGVDMLTMCNNHALDGWFDGLKESIDLAEQAGLKHVGAYRTQAEHDTPEIYDIGGIKIGMLNYTQSTNSMENRGVDPEALIYGLRKMDKANYAADIANLKSGGAEFVICFMHWGKEYERTPESDTRDVAKKLVAAGADLVIGGHPHVVQPAEYVTATDANGNSRTALVIYSLGNYISNHRNDKKRYTDNGIIFDFTLQEQPGGGFAVVNPNAIPVYVWQAGSGDYRVVPTGLYMSSRPDGMSDSEYARMCETWTEIEQLMAGVIPVCAS